MDTPEYGEEPENTEAVISSSESHAIERRGEKCFVTFQHLGLELSPAFETEYTADEVARNYSAGEAFFTHIPTVPYGTPYPRPSVTPKGKRPPRVIKSHRPMG